MLLIGLPLSILAHGLSSTPLAKRIGKR